MASYYYTKISVSTQDKGGVLQTTVVYKTDTVYIKVPSLIRYITSKPKLIYVYKNRAVSPTQPDGSPTLLHRVYSDSTKVEKGLTLTYEARVSGALDSIQLGIRDTRPLKEIHTTETITNKETIIKRPTGIYVGVQGNQTLTSFGPTVELVRPKFKIGVGYDVRNTAPTFHFGINLVKDKQK